MESEEAIPSPVSVFRAWTRQQYVPSAKMSVTVPASDDVELLLELSPVAAASKFGT
jgi:hypothetical protein